MREEVALKINLPESRVQVRYEIIKCYLLYFTTVSIIKNMDTRTIFDEILISI